ncbi:MAG TPA: rhomboid family intramembrane serine protease [Chloroflexota bacterium]|nr:rhomboid family intramembrane serine protease [Chloroflexota bacterium]
MSGPAVIANPQRHIEELLRRERFREALQLLATTTAAGLSPAQRLALQAEAEAGLAEFDAAEQHAREALALDPGEARAYTVLGTIALQVHRQPLQAVQLFKQAIAVDAGYAPAHFALGSVLLDAGHSEPAASELRQAQALDPTNWRYAAGLALLEPTRSRAGALRAAYRAGLAEQPRSLRLRLRLLGTYPGSLLAPLAGASRPRTADARLGYEVYRRILARPVIITYILLAINVLMYFVLEANGGSQNNATLDRFGAEDAAAIVHQHQWWRLITPVFLHAGLTHLLVNGISLYFVGTLYERCVGQARFLYVYLFAGIGGSLASLAFTTDLAVGASGAIFGIFGALGVYFYRNRALFGRIARSLVGQILVLTVLNLLLPNVVANIDGWAHVGGLVAGVIAAWIVGPALPAPTPDATPEALLREQRPPARIAAELVIAALLLCVVAAALIAWNPAGA